MNNVNKIFSVGILAMFLLATITPALEIKNIGQNTENTVLNFSFSKPYMERINVKDEMYDRITIDGLSNTRNFKYPCLPIKSLRILLPYGKELEKINVFAYGYTHLGTGYHIEMGGKVVPLSVKYHNIESNHDDFSFFSEYIHQSSPLLLYEKIGVYNYRGFNILHINLYPVQYDIDTEDISFYGEMTIVVETKESSINKGFRGSSEDYDLVNNLVNNPSELSTYYFDMPKNSLTMDSYEYIIITNEEFRNSQGEYTFQDLIQSKIDKGISAGIFTVEEIINNPNYEVFGEWGDANPLNPFYENEITDNFELFDDEPAKIRNFIRHAYTEWGTNYVLLGGDADEIVDDDNIVPLRGLFADEDGLPLDKEFLEHEEDDIPSDVYYACLNGNFNYDCDEHFGESKHYNDVDTELDEADLYAEVWVGRACVDSSEEISNFVMKTLWYEQTNDPYVSEILFIGEYLGFPGVSAYGGNYKDHTEDEVDIPDMFNINKIYDRDERWYPDFLIPHLSTNPYHLINHDGHGNENYILKTSGYNIGLLTNEKPFFIYSHSCLTGSFDNWDCYKGYQENDCIAEIITCEIPYGAFACILNSRYGLGSEDSLESPSGDYDKSFYKALFEENIRELGKASHYSKQDNIGRIDENGMRWCYYETNLFGDPEISIKNSNHLPDKPIIEGPTKGKTGESYYYNISMFDPDGNNLLELKIDFGDGDVVSLYPPNHSWPSGSTENVEHIWHDKGTYAVKARVMEESGGWSEWGLLEVKMPINQIILNQPIQNLFEKFSWFYQLLTYSFEKMIF